MTHEEIKKRLELMNLHEVARQSGISRNALHRFMHKTRPTPYERTLEKLNRFLETL